VAPKSPFASLTLPRGPRIAEYEVITSVRAAPVVAARALHRHRDRAETGRFLAEGPRPVTEALAEHRRARDVVVELFCTEGADVRHPGIVAAAQELGVPTYVVNDRVAAVLAETRTPQGVVAVCTQPVVSLSAVLASTPRLLAVLVDVADPGNAGTVIRVADAAGADAVLFAGTTVDPYNGKCVRASAGSVFHLPVVAGLDVAALTTALKDAGIATVAADARADLDIDDAARQGLFDRPIAWLFGHEVRGLTGATDGTGISADHAVRVPIYGRAESLNLATAAAICLYAAPNRGHNQAR
jgi:TrmH family RNA methyltransferase